MRPVSTPRAAYSTRYTSIVTHSQRIMIESMMEAQSHTVLVTIHSLCPESKIDWICGAIGLDPNVPIVKPLVLPLANMDGFEWHNAPAVVLLCPPADSL